MVVIVGATGGIGSTLTRKLAEMETKLVLAARDSSRLENLASSVAIQPGQVLTVPCDITQPQQVKNLMEKAVANFGQIDALVNAAGAGILKQYNKLEPADLDAMLDLTSSRR